MSSKHHMWQRGLWLLVVVAAGCHSDSAELLVDSPTIEPPWFEDVTRQSGINFVQDPGPEGSYFMPQSMGTGAALIDFDADGDLDIYLLHGAGPGSGKSNRLFEQRSPGQFVDGSTGSGLDVAGFCTGVAVGDVDNDGFPDLLLTEYGGVRLFQNNGGASFTDISTDAQLQSLDWGTSAAFFDYNRDGWLDLFVVNYVLLDPAKVCFTASGKREFCQPDQFPTVSSRLYRNLTGTNGGQVRFQDVTEQAGVAKPGPGLGVLCADFDGDRWPDVFVANDQVPNRLWINQCDGTFQDEAVSRGVAVTGQGQAAADMGIAWGDVDGDGLFDLFVTHLGLESHTLWKQGPRGLFRDATAEANLAAVRTTGFGTTMTDFDHDGDLDLMFVNGRVSSGPPVAADSLGPFWSRYAEHNSLFENDGQGRFFGIGLESPDCCGRADVGRGLCCGDLDGDGSPDLLLTPTFASAMLLRNVAPSKGHWLIVRAIDPALKRDAYGAEVTVSAGQRNWIGSINPGSSYLCSNDPRAHFGLGAHDVLDRIDVIWPDGDAERFAGTRADQVLLLEKGQGQPQ